MIRMLLFILSFFLISQPISSQTNLEYVNLFIGTYDDHGQLDPAATVPFGMIKLGPDTRPGNHSGYNFNAHEILGFSHNRIGGVGCSGAGGNLRIFPGIGNLLSPNRKIDKSVEKASPGYYSITFKNGILAELTSTNETGFHKYRYPDSDSAFLEIDIKSSFADFIDAQYSILNKNELFVTVSSKNVCNFGRYTMYYHIWSDSDLEFLKEEEGKIYFKPILNSFQSLNLKVTGSVINTETAKNEWKAYPKAISFEEAKKAAYLKWDTALSKIDVEGKEDYKTLFYSLLYRTMLSPVKISSSNGVSKSSNGLIYSNDDYTNYASWSMWDTFRNKFSLISIIDPEISSDFAKSLTRLTSTGKAIWSSYNEPVPTVRTEHTIIALLELYKSGITDFDLEKAYGSMSSEIANISADSPDSKLELSYDYWAMSKIASILGNKKDEQFFLNKAMDYKGVWREKFLNITDKSDIMHGDGLYEGTLWQYRWHVQFDIQGIIDMIGGDEKFSEQLEFFFDNDLYNHGNQPDLHSPFLFNFANTPWLTQKWVNKILTKDMIQAYGTHNKWDKPYIGPIYKAEPKGFIREMDDDDGTMSSWYVLSSMGLYPVLVGDATFQLSTPIFDKITFNLNGGKTFVIETKDFSNDSFYIHSATLNGKSFDKSFLTHQQIMQGGNLVIQTSKFPNKNRGIYEN